MPDEQHEEDVEIVSPSEAARWQRENWVRRTRAAFVAWGLLAGVAGAVVAYVATSSWELALFVLPMVSYVVGRGIAHVVTDRGKVARALFFGLAPLAGSAALAAAYARWGRWWAAVLLGAAAWFLGAPVARRIFRRVAHEERLERIRGV